MGVDNANIADFAKVIVEKNGFSDKVKILKGKIEEVELPCKEVDIIISEWMGYFLLYESMLDSVIWARDKYMKPDGMMFPDKATLYLTTMEDEEYFNSKVHFWDDVHGFDMSCITEWV